MPASRKDLTSSYFPSESAGCWNNCRHCLFLSAGQKNSHQSEESITIQEHQRQPISLKAANLPLDPISSLFTLFPSPTLFLHLLILYNCLLCLFESSFRRHNLLGTVPQAYNPSTAEVQAGGRLQSQPGLRVKPLHSQR